MERWSTLARETGLIHTIDVSADALAVLDPHGDLVECNQLFSELVARDRTLAGGSWAGVLVEPDHREDVIAQFRRARAGETVRYLVKGRRRDGRAAYADVTNAPLFDNEGQLRGVFVAVREATVSTRRGAGRDVYNAWLRMAERSARFAVWEQNVDDEVWRGPSVSLDAAIAALAGPVEERSDAIEAILRAVAKTGNSIDRLVELIDDAGRPLRLRFVADPIEGDDGRVVRVEGAFFDVTVFYTQQEELIRIERRVRSTLDEMDAVIFFIDREYVITYANEAGVAFAQRPREEMIGQNLWTVFPAMRSGEVPMMCAAAMAERRYGKVIEFVDRLQGWYEVSTYAAGDGVAITARDVSLSHEVLDRLEESSERAEFLSRMVDFASDAMITRDFEKGITYLNAAAERIYGYRFEDVVGTTPESYLYPDPGQFEMAEAHVRREGWWQGRLLSRARDGRILTIDSRWQLIRDRDGVARGVFSVNRDITAALAEEDRRIRAQRMESLGTFAGGVAHDLNNVLTPIMMSLEVLARDERDPARRELIDTMERSVARGSDMVRQILSFARGVDGEHLHVDTADLVDEVVRFSRDALPKNIELSVEVAPDLYTVQGDRTQLVQVLLNLVTNARDAMPNGGHLRISARNMPGVHLDFMGSSSMSGVDHVVLEVSDEGAGMDRETVGRVFEPFFTTKPAGLGSGLGMSTSQAIVRGHGGWIEIESEVGAGTSVTVVLPADAQSDIPRPITPAPAVATGVPVTGRVLVVDDEPAIVTLISTVLADSGYEVESAIDGLSALAVCEHADFDVVLTDVNMPRVNGPELIERLREMGKTPRVIYMSGLGLEPTLDDVTPRPDILAKPFQTRALLDLVAQVLTFA